MSSMSDGGKIKLKPRISPSSTFLHCVITRRLERKELEWEKVKDKEKTERGFQEKIAEFKKRYQDSAAKVVM